jgi:predicted ribonuclease toxin of YeeF-YezG toxin-antitoxin module
MFPIPLPWLIVGALVSLFGTYQVGHHYGWLERDGDMKIAIAKKNDEARQIEQNMTEKLSQQSAKLQEANDAINKKTTALAVANRAGKLRLCPPSNVQTTTNTASTSADSKATSQSDRPTNEPSDAERATIDAIAEIVAQGDKNTVALNACVDSYNQMRDLLNDKR